MDLCIQDGPLAEALGAWKAEPKTTYQALQKPVSEKNEERVKQQAAGKTDRAARFLNPAGIHTHISGKAFQSLCELHRKT